MNKEIKKTKGLILAGGSGKRLYPITKITSKQLLPIYNKPMIYYPLKVLVDAGIKDIMLITTKEDQDNFKKLLGDGKEWGVDITYEVQKKPEGIAQSLVIAEEWLEGDSVALILGDNLFIGPGLEEKIKNNLSNKSGATIFCIEVDDPSRFGVVEIDDSNKVISIEEKPDKPKTNWAVTGLYIYDHNASSYAKTLKKSNRGEFEITDINLKYLENKSLNVEFLNKEDISWLDTGTFDSLLEASNFIKNIEN